MKAPPFDYVRATTLAEVFQLWAKAGPEARLLAGGQSLIATLALRLSEPSVLIDITRVPDLRGIRQKGEALSIGALTTQAELGADPLVRQHAPLLAEAVPLIAHPAIRNRGTLGGSLAFADPAAELPACCVALGATIVAVSPTGERRIPARAFFQGLYTTALAPNELIMAVEVSQRRGGQHSTILELTRRSGDYAMAGVAAATVLEQSRLVDPQFVFFALGEAPVVARSAMAALADRVPDRTVIAAALAALKGDLDPLADLNGGSDMKRHLAGVLLERAIARLSRGKEARAA
jgi:aerobic carbon-monoxide dehydrogenase medium subunit